MCGLALSYYQTQSLLCTPFGLTSIVYLQFFGPPAGAMFSEERRSELLAGSIRHTGEEKLLRHVRRKCVGDQHSEHDILSQDQIIVKPAVDQEKEDMGRRENQTDHARACPVGRQPAPAHLRMVVVQQQCDVERRNRQVYPVQQEEVRVGKHSGPGQAHQEQIQLPAHTRFSASVVLDYAVVHHAQIDGTDHRDERGERGDKVPAGVESLPGGGPRVV